jgi:hypothetical protein
MGRSVPTQGTEARSRRKRVSINPTDPGSIDRTPGSRLRKTPGGTPGEPKRSIGQPNGSNRADHAEISEGARQLLEANGLPPENSEDLTPAQLQEVLDRIAGEFYERPEIRDQVIRRILPHLRQN